MLNLQSTLGILAILALAWLISENRRAVNWRQAGIALGVTLLLALVMLKVPKAEVVFALINDAVNAIATATRAGTSFVFGYVGGGPLPFEVKEPAATFILGFQALPVVLVMSVLSSLLFYWGIMPPIVRGFSRVLEKTLDVGGAVGLSTAANIFVGQVEAPLFIRPYLAKLSRAEMFVVMTGGMAGIAGTVFVLYATILANAIPDAAGHIVVCSVLGAPAAILISFIMVPDPGERHTGGALGEVEQVASSTMDAIVKGTGAGLELLLNIVAMLIVFIALVYLANAFLGLLPDIVRRAAHLAAHARLGDGADLLADGHSVGASGDRGRPDGDQDDLERACRLSAARGAACRCAGSPFAADHALRHVRLRQFRLARHHDRGALDDVPGEARRGGVAGPEVDRVGDADDVFVGGDRGDDELRTDDGRQRTD